MRADLYPELHRLEKNYWWHVGKRDIVFSLLDSYWTNHVGESMILDVGCGAGLMLECLKRYGTPLGLDFSKDALHYCQKRQLNFLCQADASAFLPFKDSSFDLITVLDLLEHLDDDERVLKEFFRVLNQEGILLISAPAFRFLWSYWDEMLHHKRRYTVVELRDKLSRAGFSIRKISYSNAFIFSPVIVVRQLKRLWNSNSQTQTSDFMPVPSMVNAVLKLLYRVEASLLKRLSFPFGLSVICLAQKG